MPNHSLPEAAHADRLTDALRRSGALGESRVLDVVVESSRRCEAIQGVSDRGSVWIAVARNNGARDYFIC
jgi:hypothetical protein